MSITKDQVLINRAGDNYEDFLISIRNHFDDVVSSGIPLFTTNAEDLFAVFLNKIPVDARQHYSCNACKKFVDKFGGLVTISHDGAVSPALWGDVPKFFIPAVKAVKKTIKKSKVNGVFISEKDILGQPATGEWYHMAVELPADYVFHSRIKNAGQLMAEKREDYRILIAGLKEYPVKAVEQAIKLLKTESIDRPEKFLGIAEWIKDLHNRQSGEKNSTKRRNMLWLAVGTAPAGFCHIRSNMIGTLLDDIVSGLPYESVRRRFADKVHPLQYQRPQAPPTAGNIARGEKIVKEMGLENSLVRRFARVEELQAIWKPTSVQESDSKSDGVFGHLTLKGENKIEEMDIPPVTMTWDKFYRTVFPDMLEMDYFVKSNLAGYSAILTAQHEDAPPIIQWDDTDNRNPFNWYVYPNGSYPNAWNLQPGYCKVTAVCFQPSMWQEGFDHHGKSIFFILDGAKDTSYKGSGNALFPETLKGELREIRATIEAYSRNAETQGYNDATACGVRLQVGSNWDATFRVKTKDGQYAYRLDRWD